MRLTAGCPAARFQAPHGPGCRVGLSPSPACPALQVQTDGTDVEVPDKGLQTYEPEDALNAALDALQNEMQEMESSFAVSIMCAGTAEPATLERMSFQACLRPGFCYEFARAGQVSTPVILKLPMQRLKARGGPVCTSMRMIPHCPALGPILTLS